MLQNKAERHNSNMIFISSLSILWLLIPFIVFTCAYYKLYLLLPTMIVVSYLAEPSIKYLSNFRKIDWRTSHVIPALCISIILTWSSGILPPLGMSTDWFKHFAILNLLVDSDSWPPTISLNGETYLLRYNIALYEVPALLEKIMPLGIRYWMAFYETIGLFLFFICLTCSANKSDQHIKRIWLKNTTIIFLFIGFSGLDIVGTILSDIPINPRIPHLEWWDRGYDSNSLAWWNHTSSFSSIMTQYFWVPQHCLPAWLGVSLLYANMKQKDILPNKSFFLLLLLIFFWSPFIFIGTIFLVSIYAGDSVILSRNNSNFFIAVFFLSAPLFIFYTTNTTDIPRYFELDTTLTTLPRIVNFLFMEVFIYLGLLFFMARTSIRKKLLLNMAIIFIICVSYHYGIYNDFSLKVSIPALTLLAIFVAKALTTPIKSNVSQKVFSLGLLVVYFIGLATPAVEIVRGYTYYPNVYATDVRDTKGPFAIFFRQYFVPIDKKPFFIKE